MIHRFYQLRDKTTADHISSVWLQNGTKWRGKTGSVNEVMCFVQYLCTQHVQKRAPSAGVQIMLSVPCGIYVLKVPTRLEITLCNRHQWEYISPSSSVKGFWSHYSSVFCCQLRYMMKSNADTEDHKTQANKTQGSNHNGGKHKGPRLSK